MYRLPGAVFHASNLEQHYPGLRALFNMPAPGSSLRDQPSSRPKLTCTTVVGISRNECKRPATYKHQPHRICHGHARRSGPAEHRFLQLPSGKHRHWIEGMLSVKGTTGSISESSGTPPKGQPPGPQLPSMLLGGVGNCAPSVSAP